MSAITFRTFNKNFQLVKTLGSGANAVVYEIKDISDNQPYALKVMGLKKFDDTASAINQIVLINALNDPSTPKIYYYFTSEQSFGRILDPKHKYFLYIIMERCQMSLDVYMRRRQFPQQLCVVVRCFLITMISLFAKMQQRGILHRDIKPDNILVNKTSMKDPLPEFKLADFGYSIFDNPFGRLSITGTQEYVSPKLLRKFKDNQIQVEAINYRDEVFSLGKTILEMIAGRIVYNSQISEDMIKELKEFSPFVGYFMEFMLQFNEDDRPDFIQLNQQMQRILHQEQFMNQQKNLQFTKNYNSNPNLIQNHNLNPNDVIENHHSNPNVIQNYYGSKQNPINLYESCEISRNQRHLQFTSQNLSSNYHSQNNNFTRQNYINLVDDFNDVDTKKKIKKNDHSNSNDETKYMQNNIGQEAQKIQQLKGILKKKEIDFRGNQIFSIKVVGDYAFLGMKQRLGVIPLKYINTKNGHVYQLKLPQIKKSRKSFTINKVEFISESNQIVLFLNDKNIVFIEMDKIVQAIDNLVENNLRNRIDRSVVYEVFNRWLSSETKFAKIYQTDFKQVKLFQTKSQISHLTYIGNQNYLFGCTDGQILHYNQNEKKDGKFEGTVIYKASSKINDMKLTSDKLIFYSGKQIEILEFKETNKNYQIKHKTLPKAICYIKLIKHENQTKYPDQYIPFVEALTVDGKQYFLNKNLQICSVNYLFNEETFITSVSETDFQWSIKREKQQNIIKNVVQIKKHSQDSPLLSYLTFDGQIKYLETRKNMRSQPFNKALTAHHISKQHLITCNPKGLVEVIFLSEEGPKRQDKESNQMSKKSVQTCKQGSKNPLKQSLLTTNCTDNFYSQSSNKSLYSNFSPGQSYGTQKTERQLVNCYNGSSYDHRQMNRNDTSISLQKGCFTKKVNYGGPKYS